MRNFKFLENNNVGIIDLNDFWETRTEAPVFDGENRFLTLYNRPDNNNNEYCFQFDDDEPQVFAVGNERLTMEISPNNTANITFETNGRIFRIFARERQV